MRLNHLVIVGLGSIGRRHLRILKEFYPKVLITAVRSGMGDHSSEESLLDNTVSSIDQAISRGAQAAIISSPAVCHYDHVMDCFKNDIPVLIEKPLTNDLSSSMELALLSDKYKSFVGYTFRCRADALDFHSELNSRDIAKILYVNIFASSYLPEWRPGVDYRRTVSSKKELGGGVLLELSHEIDYAYFFFGPFVSVQASLINTGSLDVDDDVEDLAILNLITSYGFTVYIYLDFCSRNIKRSCHVHYSIGDLTWDLQKQQVSWCGEGSDFNKVYKETRDEVFQTQLKEFVGLIEGEDSKFPLCGLKDAAQVMHIIDAAKKSNSLGLPVEL